MSIQENAIGIAIEFAVLNADGSGKDISGATVKKLLFKKPNGLRMEKVAAFSNTGSDGLLVVTTVDGDLVPYGVFEVQADLIFATSAMRSAIDTLPVARNL